MVYIFIGKLIRVLSHSYFARHICSNGKVCYTKRGWSYFSYLYYVAMDGDNRIKNNNNKSAFQICQAKSNISLERGVWKEDNPRHYYVYKTNVLG